MPRVEQYPRDTHSRFVVVTYLVLPFLGGVLGLAGCIGAAILLESNDQSSEPVLSYGQQWGLISLPICTMIGAGVGFGVALSVARRHLISIVVLGTLGFLGSAAVTSLWNDQIARYGRDPSEVVLYYPPMAASVLALVVAAMIGLIAGVVRIASGRHVTRR